MCIVIFFRFYKEINRFLGLMILKSVAKDVNDCYYIKIEMKALTFGRDYGFIAIHCCLKGNLYQILTELRKRLLFMVMPVCDTYLENDNQEEMT